MLAKSHSKRAIQGGDLKNNEFKILLDASYDNNVNTLPWIRDKDLSSTNTKVFYDPATMKAVVAHKGTDYSLRDWGNNITYAVGGIKSYKKTDRFKEAQQIQKQAEAKYGASNITTIGHSQGGLQAELLGKNTNEIITYNKMTAPGVENKFKPNQKDVSTKGDIVSKLNPLQKKENKNTEVLDYNSWNPLKNHSTEGLQDGGSMNSKIVAKLIATGKFDFGRMKNPSKNIVSKYGTKEFKTGANITRVRNTLQTYHRKLKLPKAYFTIDRFGTWPQINAFIKEKKLDFEEIKNKYNQGIHAEVEQLKKGNSYRNYGSKGSYAGQTEIPRLQRQLIYYDQRMARVPIGV